MITNTRSDRVVLVVLIMLAMITFLVVAFVGFARFERSSVIAAWNGHSPFDAISNQDVAEDVLRLMRANKGMFVSGRQVNGLGIPLYRDTTEMGSTIDCRHFWISIHPPIRLACW